MEEIEKIANEVRREISEFCINECHAYCCRKGYLPLLEEEVNSVFKKYKEKLILEGSLKKMENGKFLLNFENSFFGCPLLKNFMCTIHSNSSRPKICYDFPIFIVGKKIKISNRCPAKRANKFFKFEKDVERLGYEITEELF